MSINVVYDQGVALRPAGFTAAIEYVKNLYNTIFATSASFNINVGFGTVNGVVRNISLATSSTFGNTQYDFGQVTAALLAQNAGAAVSLPVSDPTGGQQILTSNAQQKVLGLWTGNANSVDGGIGFSNTANFDYGLAGPSNANAYDFIAAAEHEFSEVMGRSYGASHPAGVVSLYTYSSPGVLVAPGTGGSYFSTDRGQTVLQYFNNPSVNGGDDSDWAQSASNDAFVAATSSGHKLNLSGTDLTLMKAMGWQTNTIGTGMNFGGVGETDLFNKDSAGTLSRMQLGANGLVTSTVQQSGSVFTLGANITGASININNIAVAVAAGSAVAVSGISNTVSLAAGSAVVINGTFNTVTGSARDAITLLGSNNHATAGAYTTLVDTGNHDIVSVGSNSVVTETGSDNSVTTGTVAFVSDSGIRNTITISNSSTLIASGSNEECLVGTGSTIVISGTGNRTTAVGASAVSFTGTGNVANIGAGSMTTLSGNGNLVETTGGTINIAASITATIKGNGIWVNAAAAANLTIGVGTGIVVIASDATVTGATNTGFDLVGGHDAITSATMPMLA